MPRAGRRAQRALSACLLGAVLGAVVPGVQAQETPVGTPPQPEPVPSPSPSPEPLGPLKVGSVYLRPFFTLGTLGVDTNVFYTATDRQADFTASGGPGVEAALPVGGATTLKARAIADYLYFARTEEQRKLRGEIGAGLDWKRPRTGLRLDERLARLFSRPSFEVDERVEQDYEGTRLDLDRRLWGHFSLRAELLRFRNEVPEAQEYRGTDLRATLSEHQRGGLAELRYAITVKTSWLLRADYRRRRFPFATDARDADHWLLQAGLETDPTALVVGRLLLGYGLHDPADASLDEQPFFDLDLDAMWNVSPRTRLGGGWVRTLDYSAFQAVEGGTPTLTRRTVQLRLEKELWAQRVDLKAFWRRTAYTTESPVVIEDSAGVPQVGVRDDVARELGADLGYRFRAGRLRVGLVGTWTDRDSSFEDFGIEGLLLGASLTYAP